ncbi:MAG: hypothetical protein K8T25_23355 [Planctomycetia bacterium]|nr:hypothetical protein [Planctomycetia bacterium]
MRPLASIRPGVVAGGRRLLLLSLFAAASAAMLLAPAARAEDVTTAVPSLKLAPADSAFYSSMLRGREQIDIIAKSKFWKKLQAMDFYKQMEINIKRALEQPGPAGQFMTKMELPENQQALGVIKEMFSEEVFTFGNGDVADTITVVNDVMNAARFGPMFYNLTGGGELTQDQYVARMSLNALNADIDKIKVPEIIIGFKIQSAEPAEEQLRRLEGYATVLLEQVPELAKWRSKFKRAKIAGGEFLTLTVDGAMIPWENIPFDDVAEQKGQYDKLREKLRGLKVVICLGVRQGNVILSIGKSTDYLAALGTGESLAANPKLKPLRDHAGEKLTGVTFVSQLLAQSTGVKPKDVDMWVDVAKRLLPTTKLSTEDQKQILSDVDDLAKELKTRIPTADAMLGFSFLSPRGIEAYEYNWAQNPYLDGTQKLPIVTHLGSTPLLAIATRSKNRPQDYDLLVRWLGKGRGYFEKFAVPTMDEQAQGRYKQFSEIAYPLLERIDGINRKLMLPALADGQMAVVLDSSLKSKQWADKLPETAEPTGLPLPALVLGVSDQAKVEQALGEYRGVANDLIKKLRPFAPPNVPEFELPPAKIHELEGEQKVYFYPLPKEFAIDKRLAPNAGLSPQFLVFSLTPRMTTDLLKSQPLSGSLTGPSSPLGVVADKPMQAAVAFDFPQFVDLVVPWVNEVVRFKVREMEQAFKAALDDPNDPMGGLKLPPGDSPTTIAILTQIKEGTELLKAFRGMTSATYLEDGVQVTHNEAVFQDVP